MSEWIPVAQRPEIDEQPSRQFILLQGQRDHSGSSWMRKWAGEAFIRKVGAEDEMLQYREADILRLCKDGDIDPFTARVTHWMPHRLPGYPQAHSNCGGGE